MFILLDERKRGYITKRVLSDFLIENADYFASERELKIVMGVVDKQNKQYVDYNSFCEALRPVSYR